MADSIKFGNLMFTVRSSTEIRLCPGHFANKLCPTGVPVSPRRKAPKPTDAPKLSTVATAMDKIIHDGAVSALCSDNGRVYCEVATSSSPSPICIYYDNEKRTLYCNDKHSAAIPIFLSALSPELANSVTFTYTATAIEQAIMVYDATAKTLPIKEMGYLCDCFYYDMVALFGDSQSEITVSDLTADKKLEIQQAIRTNTLHAFDGPISAYIQQTFTEVSYTPPVRSSHPSKGINASPAWFASCKEGEYEIGFDWTREQQTRIRKPSFLDSFVPNKEHAKLTNLISYDLNEVIDRLNSGIEGVEAIQDNYINAILVGKPGTGKTTTAEALSATLRMPIYTVKNSKNTEEDTFEGMTKVSNGSFLFKSTPFLEAYEHGGIIVLEEFNLADPGVMQGALGQAIEYPFILMRDGCEEVRRHPMCVIISTMNTGTQGAREPNQALTSRSPTTLIMDDPTKEDFLKILENKGYKARDCNNIYKAYTKILDYLCQEAHSEELAMCVTMRHCIGALKLMKIGEPIKDAIYDTMIGAIAIRDLQIAYETFNTAVKPLALN